MVIHQLSPQGGKFRLTAHPPPLGERSEPEFLWGRRRLSSLILSDGRPFCGKACVLQWLKGRVSG
jgi:hypothetical protein